MAIHTCTNTATTSDGSVPPSCAACWNESYPQPIAELSVTKDHLGNLRWHASANEIPRSTAHVLLAAAQHFEAIASELAAATKLRSDERAILDEALIATRAEVDEVKDLWLADKELLVAATKREAILSAQRDNAEANYRFMVERAADERLDGYRELGQRAAQAKQRAEAAEKREAELHAALELLARGLIRLTSHGVESREASGHNAYRAHHSDGPSIAAALVAAKGGSRG